MIVPELDDEQRRATEAPFEASFALVGKAGTGKSTALEERIERARRLHPEADPLVIRDVRTLEELAAALLAAQGRRVTLVDDVEAESLFAQACAPLFALEWEELAQGRIDPEVSALRTPERFLDAAFRLIRRLRDADFAPQRFLERSLIAATEFYGNPPNFCDPKLLLATKASFRDSLEVTPKELLQQHRREIDLAKILARLYEAYVELVESSRRMTGRDAALAAAAVLESDAGLARERRRRHRFAFVDDAQELANAHLRFLRALFGARLEGVTLCGDPACVLSSSRMSDPEATFSLAVERIELRREHRCPQREVARFETPAQEGAAIADRVAEWIGAGIPPERIAVLLRSVQCARAYESALLDRNIAVVMTGDSNVFSDPRALDALALLWNVHDPFRHDYLLRTLAGAAVGLSDASLAVLCSEPPDPQRSLFTMDDEPPATPRSTRWNARRDLRLGWNLIRGERDGELGEEAAQRVRRFRASRARWLELLDELPFESFARAVWSEGLARDGEIGSARARVQQHVLRRLLDRLEAFSAANPAATLGDLLEYCELRMASDLESCESKDEDRGFVALRSVEGARGLEYDRVVVASVRPGAFPRWYSPEAFMFSPRLGLVPKETAGDARAARTAKYTYYLFRSKAAQRYFERERRALQYAIARGRQWALVTASGSPIRTATAPELLEELR